MTTQFANRENYWLCALLALFMTACASKDQVAPADVEKQAFEDLRTQVREVIDEADREAKVIGIVDQLENDIADLRAVIKDRRERVLALNADYDTTRDEFAAVLAKIEKEVADNRTSVSATHRELLGAVTDEERSAIAKSRTAAMRAAKNTLTSI